MSEWVLASDIGGTFTDIVLAGPDGGWTSVKQLTTPEAPERSVVEGTRLALTQAGISPEQVVRVVHGTTLATNAVIERRGARTAFVTTEGFGDLLRISRAARVEEDRYDLHFQNQASPVSADLCFEAPERMGPKGEVLRELDDADARALSNEIARSEPEAVAICLLHSYANAEHEERLARHLAAAMPNASIVLSSRIHPEIREYDRACTTLFTAEVAPLMASYLARLEAGLQGIGIQAPLQVMESSGGVMGAQVAAERAVATLESGGAAGVMAAARFAAHQGLARVISFDMGGTTVKAGVVHDGEPQIVRELHVGGKGSFGGRRAGTGYPVKTPTVDVAELGAGGGSIAWLDPEGLLQVGPRSAGASPGPACYGRGGVEPTVTDANLVLGYLDPNNFASGKLTLDRQAAHDAIEREIAGPLGVEVDRAAWAIHDSVNASMANAIHVVTVQRGLDPREHTLVGFGGAGPMHMAGVASRFGIPTLVVPPDAGVASAVGMLSCDLRVELGQTRSIRPEELDEALAAKEFSLLRARALERMGYEQAPGELIVEQLVDARFAGQAHELSVPLRSIAARDLASLEDDFRQLYATTYGVEARGEVEYAALRTRVRVPIVAPPLPAPRARGGVAKPRAQRWMRFGEVEGEAPTYAREDLGVGANVVGPAVIDGRVETIVVPPGWQAAVDDVGSLVLTFETR